MKRPKAMIIWQGRTLLRHLAMWCARAGCAPVCVVTGGPHEPLVAREAGSIDGVLVVTNSDPSRGMLSSLQLGLRAALDGGATRVAFTPVDLPLRGSEAIEAVLAAQGEWVVPVHGAKTGHPAVVGSRAIEALIRAPLTASAREVLGVFDRVEVPVTDPGVSGNLNTPADLKRWSAARSEGAPTP